MKELLPYFVGLIGMELIALPVFFFLRRLFTDNDQLATSSVLKGMLERAVLFIGLLSGINTVLILFGALKIATRLKDEEDKISNDYFLVGNLVSILLVLLTLASLNLF